LLKKRTNGSVRYCQYTSPLSLLVPVVGLASAALLLDERLTGLQFFGAVLIMTGLYINVFGLRWRKAVKVRG
ncbi:hypothetical protein CUA56_26445, partial [Shigella boydii]|uniref:EamA family transporter n=1 Tax=Shigella boydii TaxID=621 RepID=UPI000ED72A3B